jgi:hypothetical protein
MSANYNGLREEAARQIKRQIAELEERTKNLNLFLEAFEGDPETCPDVLPEFDAVENYGDEQNCPALITIMWEWPHVQSESHWSG